MRSTLTMILAAAAFSAAIVIAGSSAGVIDAPETASNQALQQTHQQKCETVGLKQ